MSSQNNGKYILACGVLALCFSIMLFSNIHKNYNFALSQKTTFRYVTV